tara:strand:- start:321 stop:608 length:288 start_codon:yes stop_codon:yes gene_type:complete
MIINRINKLNHTNNKTIIDHTLFFIENYLPQKKNKAKSKSIKNNILEKKSNKQLFFSDFIGMVLSTPNNSKKLTITLGKWASPYLNLIRQIASLK